MARAGLSHVLEHMLFKGTTTRPGSRIDHEVQEAGGSMNAFTSFDRTVYHIDVPNTGLNVALDILCDIMQNATLPAEEMDKEKQVILREMDMNVDDPSRRASRRLFETAYTRSPYRFTVIGYPDIFNELKPDDIRAYYHEKYAPNNVFYVIVGDVTGDEVMARIRAAYSKAKARALSPVVLPEEPRQTAPREIIEEAPIALGHLHLAWHIPDVRHPDVPMLDVLAALLGAGHSSRLYREVRQKQGLVTSVDAWTYSPGNPGLFGLSATVEPDQFRPACEALLDEVRKMKAAPVAPQELGKAVKQFFAATLATRKTMQGQAQDLGANWLAANDLNFSERYLAAVKSATPADLQRVARTWLTAENRTLYALLPQGTAPAIALAGETAQDHAMQKLDLPNGLRLLLKEDHRLPFVEFRAVFKGGLLAETADNNGLTQLTGKMLLKGTRTRSADQIALSIESVGGSLDSYGGNNSFGVNAEVLSGDLATGLDLVSDVLLNPVFPPEALERERQVQLAGIRAQRDHLLQSASMAMRRALFGQTGYGLDFLGSETSVRTIQAPDLAAFHSRLTRPNNCVLAICGDIQPGAVLAAVRGALEGWTPGPNAALQGAEPRPSRESAPRRVTETRDKKQAVLVIGFPGSTLHDPDRYPLELHPGGLQRPGLPPLPAHPRKTGPGLLCRRPEFHWAGPRLLRLLCRYDAGAGPARRRGTPCRGRAAPRPGPCGRRTQPRQGQDHWPKKDRPPGPRHRGHHGCPGRTLRPWLCLLGHRRRPLPGRHTRPSQGRRAKIPQTGGLGHRGGEAGVGTAIPSLIVPPVPPRRHWQTPVRGLCNRG